MAVIGVIEHVKMLYSMVAGSNSTEDCHFLVYRYITVLTYILLITKLISRSIMSGESRNFHTTRKKQLLIQKVSTLLEKLSPFFGIAKALLLPN